jgi:hypothetical protein
MCLVIYLALIGLLLLYSVDLLDAYVLAVSSPDQPLMAVAQGWGIVAEIWPVFLLGMMVASAATFFVLQKRSGRKAATPPRTTGD